MIWKRCSTSWKNLPSKAPRIRRKRTAEPVARHDEQSAGPHAATRAKTVKASPQMEGQAQRARQNAARPAAVDGRHIQKGREPGDPGDGGEEQGEEGKAASKGRRPEWPRPPARPRRSGHGDLAGRQGELGEPAATPDGRPASGWASSRARNWAMPAAPWAGRSKIWAKATPVKPLATRPTRWMRCARARRPDGPDASSHGQDRAAASSPAASADPMTAIRSAVRAPPKARISANQQKCRMKSTSSAPAKFSKRSASGWAMRSARNWNGNYLERLLKFE